MEPPKKRNRIPSYMGVMMLIAAASIELLQLSVQIFLLLVDAIGRAALSNPVTAGAASGYGISVAEGWLAGVFGGLGTFFVGLFVPGSLIVAQGLFAAGIFILSLSINVLIAFSAGLIFYLWFRFRGVTFTERLAQRLMLFILIGAAEFIPFFGWLPILTISVYLLIRVAQKDDKAYNKKREEEWAASMKQFQKAKLLREQQRIKLEEQEMRRVLAEDARMAEQTYTTQAAAA